MNTRWLRRLVAALVVAAGPAVGIGADEAAPPPTAETIARLLHEVPLIDGHNDLPWAIRARFGSRLATVDFSGHLAARPTPARPTSVDCVRAASAAVLVGLRADRARPGRRRCGRCSSRSTSSTAWPRATPTIFEMALDRGRRAQRSTRRQDRLADRRRGRALHRRTRSAVLRLLYAARRPLHDAHPLATTTPGPTRRPTAPQHDGLTAFGAEVVREMNRLGMLVDLSHVSPSRDARRLRRRRGRRSIFSHSSRRAPSTAHPRNVPDDVLRRLPANGGVVMVNFGSYFIDPG